MIEFRNMSYRKGRLQLQIPELQLESGQICLLLGESGSGKSTFLKLAAGYLQADSGSVLRAAGLKAAYLLQNPRNQILRPTVAEELLFPLENAGLEEAERQRAVEDIMKRLALRLDPELEIRNISLGELQQVMLAATLLTDAGLLVLDEPTAHLDAPCREALFTQLRKEADGGRLILFSSQYTEDMAYADSCCVLQSGLLSYFLNPEQNRALQALLTEEGLSSEGLGCD